LFVLAKHGVLAYLIGLLLVRGVVFCYGAFALLSSSGIAHQAFVKAIFPALVASAVGYTCAEGLATLLSLRVHEPGAALIYAVSFVVGYVLSLRTIFRTWFVEMLNHLPARRAIGRCLFFKESTI
jgi:hypothetical protein